MIKPMICPGCGANIQVDDAKEYGFCSYCGIKIQLREVVEIKHSGTIEVDGIAGINQLLENGNAYLKLKDFGKAERTFKQMIADYPARREGYIGLITTYARNFEEDNLYALNQIEPLVGQLKIIGEDNNTLDFLAQTEEYCKRLSLLCEQNKLGEQILKYNKSRHNLFSAMIIFAVLIVGSFYLFFVQSYETDLARSILLFLGIIELVLVVLYSYYGKNKNECYSRVSEIEKELSEEL